MGPAPGTNFWVLTNFWRGRAGRYFGTLARSTLAVWPVPNCAAPRPALRWAKLTCVQQNGLHNLLRQSQNSGKRALSGEMRGPMPCRKPGLVG